VILHRALKFSPRYYHLVIVYKSHHVAIALHFCNKSSSDFISAIQQNLIRRGPRSGSKNPVAGFSWSASRARDAPLTGVIEACPSSFVDDVSRALWPWPRSVAVVRVSLDDSWPLPGSFSYPAQNVHALCSNPTSPPVVVPQLCAAFPSCGLWGLGFTTKFPSVTFFPPFLPRVS